MFSFCKPVSSKKRYSPHRKINDEFTFTLFEKGSFVSVADWNEIAQNKAVFFNLQYLKLIEKCTNSGLISRYVVVYKGKKPCGIIYFQVVDFSAGIFGDLMTNKVDEIKSTKVKLFESYIGTNKDEVIMRLFTCGNNLVSGEYGFLFSDSIKETDANELLIQIVEVVSKEEKLSGTISAILLKDFNHKLKPQKLFEEEKYTDFFVEPNMVIDIAESVKSLDDYLLLFSKKYRNRAKSVLKSGAAIQKVNLSLVEIKKLEKEIYDLYSEVYDRAKFKLLKLPSNYFTEVKKTFEDKFFISGFFVESTLIAFTSYFLMEDDSLEAHYIGVNYSLNNEYDLYQNILCYNINAAITNNKTKVNLGRTAAEIKTTVGAKAVDLICYAKPQNTISKLILKPFIAFLQPGEWVPRNPFKEEVDK